MQQVLELVIGRSPGGGGRQGGSRRASQWEKLVQVQVKDVSVSMYATVMLPLPKVRHFLDDICRQMLLLDGSLDQS